jgi:hypothetical protein
VWHELAELISVSELVHRLCVALLRGFPPSSHGQVGVRCRTGSSLVRLHGAGDQMSPELSDQAALERALTAFQEMAYRRIEARHSGPTQPRTSAPDVNSPCRPQEPGVRLWVLLTLVPAGAAHAA